MYYFVSLQVWFTLSYRFYFEGDFGKYLHTGDFRAAPELLKMVDDLQIDRLFVDTTFSNPKWHFASKVMK